MKLISFCTIMIILILLYAISKTGYKTIRQDGIYKLDISTQSVVLFATILILVSGVRYGFIDTYAYRIMYESSRNNLVYVYSAPWGVESTWLYLLYLLNKISSDPKLMQFLVAIMVISAFVHIIRKYSADTALSLWIFFCLTYMSTNNGMRQYFAMAITLWAFPLLIKKKMYCLYYNCSYSFTVSYFSTVLFTDSICCIRKIYE